MKKLGIVGVLFAAACAAPPQKPAPTVFPEPSPPSAFDVAISDRAPETRRYRINADEILADASNPELRYTFGSEGSSGYSPLSPAGAAGAVARLVRATVAPESWDADPRRTVFVDGEELVVRHTPEVLDRVELFIKTLKANRDALFTIKARFISVRPDELSFLEHLPMMRGGLGGVVDITTLDKTPVRGAGGHTVTAPKLALYHAQMGTIRISSDYCYIAGYEKRGTVYEPKPSVEWAGVELTARVVANGTEPDRRLLSISVTSRDIPGIPYVSGVNLGSPLGHRLYEMPLVAERTLEGAFVLGPKQALLMLAPDVQALGGTVGRLDGETPQKRIHLILVELDRTE